MARILIAEDDPGIRSLLVHALSEDDYEIHTATNGTEALEKLMEDLPDLLLLDLMMPGVDGFTILRVLKEAERSELTKIIVLTARGSERDVELGFELGADLYVTKPFDPDDVVADVREVLTLSKDELKRQRAQELDKAHLLSQLESLFGE